MISAMQARNCIGRPELSLHLVVTFLLMCVRTKNKCSHSKHDQKENAGEPVIRFALVRVVFASHEK